MLTAARWLQVDEDRVSQHNGSPQQVRYAAKPFAADVQTASRTHQPVAAHLSREPAGALLHAAHGYRNDASPRESLAPGLAASAKI